MSFTMFEISAIELTPIWGDRVWEESSPKVATLQEWLQWGMEEGLALDPSTLCGIFEAADSSLRYLREELERMDADPPWVPPVDARAMDPEGPLLLSLRAWSLCVREGRPPKDIEFLGTIISQELQAYLLNK